MKNILLKLKAIPFDNLVFIFLSLLCGGINYLYYPTMAHILSVNEFGASQALISILTQTSAVFAGLSLITIYIAKKTTKQQLNDVICSVQKLIISILMLLTLFIIILYRPISNFLHINSQYNLFLVAIDLIISIPFIMTFGYFLSQKSFIKAALLQLSVVSLKLILGIVLASWVGVFGALAAIGTGYVIGMSLFWIICKIKKISVWPYKIIDSYKPISRIDIENIKPYLKMIAAILFVSTCVTVFPSLDVVIARHYLIANESSYYAAASTLSSIILFICMPLTNILLPKIELDNIKASKQKSKQTIIYITIISFFSLTLMATIPNFLLSLFGKEYTLYSDKLWLFCINMLLICIITITSQILALFKPLTAAIITAVSIFSAYLFTSFSSHNGTAIITTFISIYLVSMFASIIQIYRLSGD